MSATTIFALETTSGNTLHIEDVNTKQRGKYSCIDCGKELYAVIGEARKKEPHFRHGDGVNCSGIGDRALHNFAVQILMDYSSLTVSKDLILNYTQPRKEVGFLDFRSDVAINYTGEIIHTEVFVTHDLTLEKISAYENNNIKCVRIDLSNPELLNAKKEKIIDEVLNRWENKTLIGWQTKMVPALTTMEADKNIKVIEHAQWTFEEVIIGFVKAIVVFAIAVVSFYLLERFLSFLFRPRYKKA